MSNGNNSLSFNEYLELIKPYLYDLINVYKNKGEWKLQLSVEISFVSRKPGSDENRVMYTRSTPDLNRITISKGGSYIESPKWLKDKKCTINQKNNDNKSFQYAATLALNINSIDKHHQRITKIKPFIYNYNWNDINFPAIKKDWNKFELNNKNVALKINLMYIKNM